MLHGNLDQGVVLPQPISILGQHDPAAIQSLLAYTNAVGVVPWTGMQGTGTFTPNTNTSAAEQAILWVQEHDRYRLDVQTPNGIRSSRILEAMGAVQHANGKMDLLNELDAMAGIVAYPMLDEAGFPNATVTLMDQGYVTVDGASLHRISVARPWPGNPKDAQGNPITSVTDLYFDPSTHLLVKSACLIAGMRKTSTRYLQVISYSDYRAVQGMQVPYQDRETINGQLIWTLQLNQMQFDNDLSDSTFHF